MKDYIFDIWTLQEIFNSLPEICWHEYRKGEFKEVKDYVYEKEWESQISHRSLPREAWEYVYPQRTGHLFVANDSSPFTRCYIGVMPPRDFLDMIKDALGISQEEVLYSADTGRVRSFKPVYMLSFLSNMQGTCIYGAVTPVKKDPSEESKQEEHDSPEGENSKSESPSEMDLKFLCVSVYPIWKYLSVIFRRDGSNRSFPKFKEIMKELQELKQRFAEKFATFESYIYDHWIVDKSFLLHYADDFSPELLVEFRKNQKLQRKTPSLKIHVTKKTIEDLEEIINKGDLQAGGRAQKALEILNKFQETYPEDYYEHERFQDLLALAGYLNNQGIEPLILSSDFSVIGSASEKGIAAGYCPPARFTILAAGSTELTRERAGEILEWFLEFIKLGDFKKCIRDRGERLVCDPIEVPKEDVLKFIKDEFNSELPSFFIEAIEEVRNKYTNSSLPPLLKDYLEGNQERKPLELSLDFLLSPDLLPGGSWPAEKGRYPFFNQYLAVAAANHHLLENGESKIVSVNGPPGTGKTTLLKEIVANTVVKMASVIEDGGFRVSKKKPGEETKLSGSYYAGFEVFAELSIVVTSANNNAVKNVTRELPLVTKNVLNEKNPLVSEILIEDKDTQRIWEKFKSIATICLNRVKKKDNYGESFRENSDNEELSCALNISAVLGKKKYSDTFLETLRWQLRVLQKDDAFADLRAERYKKARAILERAKEEFREALKRFENIRDDLRFLNENEEDYRQSKNSNRNSEKIREELKIESDRLCSLKEELTNVLRYLEKEKPDKKTKIKSFLRIREASEKIKKYEEMKRRSEELSRTVKEVEKKIRDLEMELRLQSLIQRYRDHDSALLVSKMIRVSDPEKQRLRPYGVEEIKIARERVFLTAYKVLMWTVFANLGAVKANIELLCKLRRSGARFQNGNRKEIAQIAKILWGSFFLLFPVVSTTFHSFQTLFSTLWEDRDSLPLGTIVVDEAGQGMPYMALAAFLLGRRAVVVGDPLQLEPVVPIPEEIFKVILDKYELNGEDYFYISGLNKAVSAGKTNLDSSVQVLADRASIYKGDIPQGDVKIEVGIPLRIHFRCDERIMEVANQVAYGGSMLHFKENPDPGKLVWIDVKTSKGGWKNKHFSLDEKREVLRLLEELITRWSLEEIFIISPFRAVPENLKKIRGGIIGGLSRKGNIGTVHTFQGKEARVVILMLGGKNFGARQWASEKPNLVNVAVTRAKKELYIIGDLDAWASLDHFDVLAEYAEIKDGRAFSKELFHAGRKWQEKMSLF